MNDLLTIIGRLTVQVAFLEAELAKASMPERKTMSEEDKVKLSEAFNHASD